jgi:hypothetical protein
VVGALGVTYGGSIAGAWRTALGFGVIPGMTALLLARWGTRHLNRAYMQLVH